MLRAALLFLILAGVAACTPSPSPFVGLLVYGHEVRTLQLCNHSEIYWLVTTSRQRQQLAAAVAKFSSSPYQKLYIELNGIQGNEVAGEFARGYDGTVRITAIKTISATIPEDCVAPGKTP